MLPRELSGKYEARRTLGAGAMGTVVEAFDRMIERRVAVKLVKLPEGGDAESQEAHARFRREAQAAGRLSHPNIVGVYDYGENADTAWIVMEMVEGGSLKSIIDRGDRMPVAEVVRLMDQILAALAYSHGRGVVHRDIKPANIMLAGDRSVKIADFGIARIENSSMTQVGTVMGTPAYMAPEQLRGEPVDARADIWAAGVVLYQLLTGEKPFEGNYTALMHRVLNTDPPPPSQLAVSAPRGFDGVLARALAKRPDDRFPTATAFAEAIRAAGGGAAEPTGFGFVGAGPLPGLDDATMVAAPARAPVPPPAPPPPPATPARSGPSPVLIGGVLAVLVAAGGAAFFLTGKDPAPAPVASLPATDPAPPAAPPAVEPPRPPLQAALPPPAQPAAPPPAQPSGPTTPSVPTPGLGVLAPPVVPPPAIAPAPVPAPTPAPQALTPPAPQPPVAPATTPQPAPQAAPILAAPQPVPARPQPTAEPTPSPAPGPTSGPTPGPVIAALPTPQPQPQPVAPAQPGAAPVPPRPDFRAAAQAAAAAPPCSLLDGAATDQALSVSGVLRRGGEAQIRRVLADRAIPANAATLALQNFDGPYCGALDVIRQVAAPVGGMPRVQIVGIQPLQHAELLRLDVQMPDRASYLYVSYIMKSNEIVHLVPSQPQAAGARVRLGDPRPGFPGWEVDEPYGTDLIVVFASERPLFVQPRPVIEPLDDYIAALGTALRDARMQNSAMAARAVVVETVQRR